ncbi:titin homolog isoform X2 [Nasonia vitripennis]|uniref:Uncharacterized protein n=1 Tax=Nasonia vitripennis TaxID=7425 RepID=A0A7M7QP02_NASVI|nr:titin homolog isoform X2 [Nasonia vitripennis]
MTLTDRASRAEVSPWEESEDIALEAYYRLGEDFLVTVNLHPSVDASDYEFELHRGEPPMPSDRFRVEARGNRVQLTLQHASRDDAGHYALIAKKLPHDNESERLFSRRIHMSVDEPSFTEEGDPPLFLRRLTDLTVKVGTRTRFLVEIRSTTDPKVSWHRNDEPIQAGPRFSFVHEGNFYCVDVAPVTVEDQGHWTCMAENLSGRSSCTSHLNVLVPKAYKRPEFVSELRALLTETGTVSLECKVVGVPTPVLKWFKDDKEIKAGDVFALTANPDDPTSLGTYTCEAVNCMGTAYSSSRVHVVGKGSREGSLKPADTFIVTGDPPIFKSILRDESCKIGESLSLSCKVQVPPWPKEIIWYNKEGRVEADDRYKIMEDGLGGYSIQVNPVEAVDEGEWKCVATSAENVKQFTTCYVAMSIPKNYRKPRFMESLKAVLTEEGLVSFECKVVGFPTPLLRWFKDSQELKPGDVYQLTGTNSLGSYCCIAKNCMGEAKSTAELTVEDIQNQLNEEERLQLLTTNQPPKFIKGLRSSEAKISESFKFSVQVSVMPEPSLAWYRDDHPIDNEEKYRIERETLGICHLEIKRLDFCDQAEWKCVASNDFGHSVTSCFLKLIIPRHYKKPRFLENLRAILSDGGAVNLECKVIGVPQPVLKWYKDGEELKPGDIHRIISGQDGTCCLGTYTCEATNCMGSVSSSASLLGFEDRVASAQALEGTSAMLSQIDHERELARNLSLSTIHEERTSQLLDTAQTDHSVTLDDRGEVSFSFDGKEVSVSLYETPDLTEEEALQIVEMYADQLSEHVTEHNVVELPPMRFVKETSTSGNLLMEAVVIDVSPDYFVSVEEGDDLRTEADFEDMSIMDGVSLLSPLTESIDDAREPTRPPRRKSAGSVSLKAQEQLESESFHSAKDPLTSSHKKEEADVDMDVDSEAFADALSSARTRTESIAADTKDQKELRKRSMSGTSSLEAGDSSLDSVSGIMKKKKKGDKKDKKKSRLGEKGSSEESSLGIEDEDHKKLLETKVSFADDEEEDKPASKANKERLVDLLRQISEPVLIIREALIDSDFLYEDDNLINAFVTDNIVIPIQNLCEMIDDIETKALKGAGDRSLLQNVRISILETIGGPTEELLRGLELIRREESDGNIHINLSILESLVDPVDEILFGLAKLENELSGRNISESPIVLERIIRTTNRLGTTLKEADTELKTAMGTALQKINHILNAYLNSITLNQFGVWTENIDAVLVESLARPLEDLERSSKYVMQGNYTEDTSEVISKMSDAFNEILSRLDALVVALEGYESDYRKNFVVNLKTSLVSAAEELSKAKDIKSKSFEESHDNLPEMILDSLIDAQTAVNAVLREVESTTEEKETKVPRVSELALSLAELRDAVSYAVHKTTTLRKVETINALINLKEPLIDLQLSLSVDRVSDEIPIIKNIVSPLDSLKNVMQVVIQHTEKSEPNVEVSVVIKPIYAIVEELQQQIPMILDDLEEDVFKDKADSTEVMGLGKKSAVQQTIDNLQMASELGTVHFDLATVLEKCQKDIGNVETSPIFSKISELRQSIGNTAIAIDKISTSAEPNIENLIEELLDLKIPLLRLQNALLTEDSTSREQQVIVQILQPLKRLKAVTKTFAEEVVQTEPIMSIINLIDDIRKDITLHSKIVTKKAIEEEFNIQSESYSSIDFGHKDFREKAAVESIQDLSVGEQASLRTPDSLLVDSEHDQSSQRSDANKYSQSTDEATQNLVQSDMSIESLVDRATEVSNESPDQVQRARLDKITEKRVIYPKEEFAFVISESLEEIQKDISEILEEFEQESVTTPHSVSKLAEALENLRRTILNVRSKVSKIAVEISDVNSESSHAESYDSAERISLSLKELLQPILEVREALVQTQDHRAPELLLLNRLDQPIRAIEFNVLQLALEAHSHTAESDETSSRASLDAMARALEDIESQIPVALDEVNYRQEILSVLRNVSKPLEEIRERMHEISLDSTNEDNLELDVASILNEPIDTFRDALNELFYRIGSTDHDEKNKDSTLILSYLIEPLVELQNSLSVVRSSRKTSVAETGLLDERKNVILRAVEEVRSGIDEIRNEANKTENITTVEKLIFSSIDGLDAALVSVQNQVSKAKYSRRGSCIGTLQQRAIEPLQQLAEKIGIVEEQMDENTLEFIVEPLETLWKQIQLAQTQFLQSSLDEEAIIEGFLYPAKRLLSSLESIKRERFTIQDNAVNLLQELSEGTSNLGATFLNLQNELIQEGAEENDSIIETLTAVLTPLNNVKPLINEISSSDKTAMEAPIANDQQSKVNDKKKALSLNIKGDEGELNVNVIDHEVDVRVMDRQVENKVPTILTTVETIVDEFIEVSKRETESLTTLKLASTESITEEGSLRNIDRRIEPVVIQTGEITEIDTTSENKVNDGLENKTVNLMETASDLITSRRDSVTALWSMINEPLNNLQQSITSIIETPAVIDAMNKEDVNAMQNHIIMERLTDLQTSIAAMQQIASTDSEELTLASWQENSLPALQNLAISIEELGQHLPMLATQNVTAQDNTTDTEEISYSSNITFALKTLITPLQELRERLGLIVEEQIPYESKPDEIQIGTEGFNMPQYLSKGDFEDQIESQIEILADLDLKTMETKVAVLSQKLVNEHVNVEITVVGEGSKEVMNIAPIENQQEIISNVDQTLLQNAAAEQVIAEEHSDKIQNMHIKLESENAELIVSKDLQELVSFKDAIIGQIQYDDEVEDEEQQALIDIEKAGVVGVANKDYIVTEEVIATEKVQEMESSKVDEANAAIALEENIEKVILENVETTKIETSTLSKENKQSKVSEEASSNIAITDEYSQDFCEDIPPVVLDRPSINIQEIEINKCIAVEQFEKDEVNNQLKDLAFQEELESTAVITQQPEHELVCENIKTSQVKAIAFPETRQEILDNTAEFVDDQLKSMSEDKADVMIKEVPLSEHILAQEQVTVNSTQELNSSNITEIQKGLVSIEPARDFNGIDHLNKPEIQVAESTTSKPDKDLKLTTATIETIDNDEDIASIDSLKMESDHVKTVLIAHEAPVSSEVVGEDSVKEMADLKDVNHTENNVTLSMQTSEELTFGEVTTIDVKQKSGDHEVDFSKTEENAEIKKQEQSEKLEIEEEEGKLIEEVEESKKNKREKSKEERERRENIAEAEKLKKEKGEHETKNEAEDLNRKKDEPEKKQEEHRKQLEEAEKLNTEQTETLEEEKRTKKEEDEKLNKEEEECKKKKVDDGQEQAKAKREQKEEDEHRKKEEDDRKIQEEAKKLKTEKEERENKESAKKLKLEEDQKNIKKSEKVKKEEVEHKEKEKRRKHEEAEKLKTEEAEKLKEEEKDHKKRKEAEKLEIEKEERSKKEEAECKKQEKAEEVKEEEDERKKKQEAEKLKEEEERKKTEAAEKLKLEEEEREKKVEAEKLKKDEEEFKQKAEAEKLRLEEEDRKKKKEAEQLKKEEVEHKKKEKAEKLKKEEEELKKKEESEKLKKEEDEHKKKEEAEKLRLEEEERKKKKEVEQLKKEEEERKKKEEAEKLKKEEEERKKEEKAEKLRLEEEDRKKKEKAEKLRLEEEDRKKTEKAEKLRLEEEDRKKTEKAEKLRLEEEDRKKKEKAEKLRLEEEDRKKKEKAEKLRLEEEDRKKEEAEKLKLEEEEHKKKEEAEKLKLEEEERKKKEEAEKLKKEEEERKKKEEAEKLRLEEEERKKKEEAQKLKLEEEERKKKEEAEKVKLEEEDRKKEEAEKLKLEEEERKKKEEAEKFKKEEEGRKKKEEAEKLKKEEEDRKMKEEAEKLRLDEVDRKKKEEAEKLKLEEEERKKKDEAEKLKKKEVEHKKKEEAEKLRLEEEERKKKEEVEKLRLEEEERKKKKEAEQLKKEQVEHKKKEEAEKLKKKEEELKKKEESEKLKKEEDEHKKKEEAEKVKLEEEECKKKEEAEKVKLEEEECKKKKEAEQLKKEEVEHKKEEEAEKLENEEEELKKKEESEKLKKEEDEHKKKEEAEKVKLEEEKCKKKEEAEKVKLEEEECKKKKEAEQLKKEEVEHYKEEEAEKLENEEEELKKKEESEKLKKEENEYKKKEEAEKVKLEEEECKKKEEAEQVKLEEEECKKKEEAKKVKKEEEERKKKEEAEKVKNEEEERKNKEETEQLKKEEEERRKKEESEKLKKEKDERKKKEEAEQLKKEEEERKKKEEAEKLQKEEEELKKKEEPEKLKKEEDERKKKEEAEKVKLEEEECKKKEEAYKYNFDATESLWSSIEKPLDSLQHLIADIFQTPTTLETIAVAEASLAQLKIEEHLSNLQLSIAAIKLTAGERIENISSLKEGNDSIPLQNLASSLESFCNYLPQIASQTNITQESEKLEDIPYAKPNIAIALELMIKPLQELQESLGLVIEDAPQQMLLHEQTKKDKVSKSGKVQDKKRKEKKETENTTKGEELLKDESSKKYKKESEKKRPEEPLKSPKDENKKKEATERLEKNEEEHKQKVENERLQAKEKQDDECYKKAVEHKEKEEFDAIENEQVADKKEQDDGLKIKYADKLKKENDEKMTRVAERLVKKEEEYKTYDRRLKEQYKINKSKQEVSNETDISHLKSSAMSKTAEYRRRENGRTESNHFEPENGMSNRTKYAKESSSQYYTDNLKVESSSSTPRSVSRDKNLHTSQFSKLSSESLYIRAKTIEKESLTRFDYKKTTISDLSRYKYDSIPDLNRLHPSSESKFLSRSREDLLRRDYDLRSSFLTLLDRASIPDLSSTGRTAYSYNLAKKYDTYSASSLNLDSDSKRRSYARSYNSSSKNFEHPTYTPKSFHSTDYSLSVSDSLALSRSRRRFESRKSAVVYDGTSSTKSSINRSQDRGKCPTFCTKLTNCTVAEGSRIRLICTTIGHPEPQVYWTKNGDRVRTGGRERIKYDNGMATLEIIATQLEDAGYYACLAKNSYGQSSTEATVRVYSVYESAPLGPTFTSALNDKYRLSDRELVLETRVRGQPTPSISWLKDERLLRGDRYKQSLLGDGVCRLEISNPDISDSGQYVCKATSEKSSEQIRHTVHFDDFETKKTRTRKDYNFDSRLYDSPRERENFPKISSTLADYKVPAGGTIALQVEIKDAHASNVTWLRDRGARKEPVTDPKTRTFAESGIYTLIVPEATESETGTYVCRVSNAYGYVDTSATVEVVPLSKFDDLGKPAMFVSRPVDKMIYVMDGEPVSVSFRVSGTPKPRVVWMKGIRDITDGPRSHKEAIDDYVRLTLNRVNSEDEGTYCILVKNIYGCDRSFFTLKVRQRAKSLTPTAERLSLSDRLSDIHIKEQQSYLRNVPGPISSEPIVVDGGRNWLSLSWGKADQRGPAPVIAYRVDAWQMGGDGGARWVELGITPINSFDAFNLRPGGEYKFRVTPRNRYGWGESVTMNGSATVSDDVEIPEFTKILPGQLKALVGSTVNLECEVRSECKFDVKWLRETTEIDSCVDSRCVIKNERSKCSLVLKNIKEDDSGRYICEVSNKAGKVSSYGRILVVNDPKILNADARLKMRFLDGLTEDVPPQFTMRLRDRRVQTSYPVRLTCQAFGCPEPEVTWFKDGKPVIETSTRSIYIDELHFHTLEIARSSLEDSGCYEACAKNENGSVSCRCILVVDKGIRAYIAPEFLYGLDVAYAVKVGGDLRLTAQIEAYPSVGIVWHRDGIRLRPRRRAAMTLSNDGTVELILAKVTSRDAGIYTCTATNEIGKAETTARVSVIGPDDGVTGVDDNFSPHVVVNPPDVDIPYSRVPLFVTKPLSTEAQEGDTVIIQCEVVGDPKPEVMWLRDFLKPDYYRDAAYFRRIGAGPQYSLEIPHAKLDYTGTYSVLARNEHGEAKAVISLQIYAKGQGRSDSTDHSSVKQGNIVSVPTIKSELKNIRCCDGDAVTLECKVYAPSEPPNIRWEKSGKPLALDGDFSAEFDGETAKLIIRHVYPEDEGEYTCVATNELGKAFTSACLVVDVPEGKENVLSQPLLTRPQGLLSANSTPRSTPRSTPVRSLSPNISRGRELKAMNLPRRIDSAGSIRRKPKICPPKFYTIPHNRVAEEGETVRFQCAVAGYPVPWCAWDKDGISVTSSARISIKEKDDVRILEIAEVTLEDAGLYRVTLENDVGRTEATARLEIINRNTLTPRPIRTRSASPRTYPTFSRSLLSTTTRLNGRLQLQCDIRGSPSPSTTWFRNGTRIERSARIKRSFVGERAVIEIAGVKESDAGEYICEAKNLLGTTRSSCKVVVLDAEDPSTKDREPPRFLQSMAEESIVMEGHSYELQARLAGTPLFTVLWLKDGHEVVDSDYYRHVVYEDGGVALRFLNIHPLDAGEYTCVVRNEHGEATCRGLFIVQDYKSASSNSMLSFVKTPVPVFAEKGETACFCARIQSDRSVDVDWAINGKSAREDYRCKIERDGSTSILRIPSVNQRDCGEIRCIASITRGPSISASAQLRLKPSKLLNSLEPRSRSLPRSKDGSVRKPNGVSTPNLRTDNCTVDAKKRASSFTRLSPKTRESSAESISSKSPAVRRKIVNGQASSMSSEKLKEPVVKTGPKLPISRKQAKESPVKKSDVAVNMEPVEITIEPIEKVHLNIEPVERVHVPIDPGFEIDQSIVEILALENIITPVSSEPEVPDKQLSKSTSPVRESSKERVVSIKRISSFKRHHHHNNNNNNEDDHNDKETTKTHVDKKPPPSPRSQTQPEEEMIMTTKQHKEISDNHRDEPALVLRPPDDVITLQGSTVLLEAEYQGHPEPSVKWMRAGRELAADERTHIDSAEGVSRLRLDGITADQSGKYAVSVENALGSDCRFASVAVEGPPEPPCDPPTVKPLRRDTGASSNGASVTWCSPAYDGGCALTGYTVECRRIGELCWRVVAENCLSLCHEAHNLHAGATYLFRVRALNVHGPGEPSPESRPFKVPFVDMDDAEDKLKVEEDQANMEDENGEYDDKEVTAEEGHLFKERYALHEELGKGRYGVVRRVVEKKSEKSFAAKIVRTVKTSDRKQVQEEMKIMNLLRHPKLLRLMAAFESPKEIVMVTEYISGGELFERVVADDFTLTEKDSILFMRQICEGVRYMHKNNVVHLDLKPENIMCHTRTSHRIKLIDFGLAQILSPSQPVRVLFGTPEFIPPEIINYEPIGTESDMWSVGVICYVLLTGLSPFMGDNDAETFANIVRADYDFEDEAFDAISPDAKDFISNLLQKKKELRMSAKQCLSHSWLAQHTENMSRVALPTDKLKKFIVRRKWQKTGNALRALGRMAMLSANRRSPSLSPTSTRSLSEVARSESLDSENLDDSVRREEDESLEHSASEGEIAKKSEQTGEMDSSKVEEESSKELNVDDVVETVKDLNMSSKEQASEDIEKDVCEVKQEDSGDKEIEASSKSNEREDDVNLCNEDNDVTEETEKVLNVQASTDDQKKKEDSDKEVSESKETAEEESDEITVIEKEEDTAEKESLEDEESVKEGSDTSIKDNKADELKKSCDVMANESTSKTIENSVFSRGISKSHFEEPMNNGSAKEVKRLNNKETGVAAGFKANKDIAFDREFTRRSFRKFNTQLEANTDEDTRLDGSPSRGRFAPTGNVSRTAKLFEKLETEQTVHHHHGNNNGLAMTTKDATVSGKPQRSERIQRAFAFWNK